MPAPWMAHAWAELGVKETPGPQSTPRVLEYLRAANIAAGDDAIPWCAAFVGWAIQRGGYRSTGKPNARSYESWGAASPPVYGAIAVFSRGSSTWQGHVTFYVETMPSGELLCLGGNQADAVCLTRYAPARLLSMRWPTARL